MNDQPKPSTESSDQLANQRGPIGLCKPKPTTGTPCHVIGPSSRICEHGTKSCEVQHTKPTTGDWTAQRIVDYLGWGDYINPLDIPSEQRIRDLQRLSDAFNAALAAAWKDELETQLAAAQAAIASIPKSFGGAGEAYGILTNLKAKFNDTTALDAAIAEAVKAENKRMMEFWQGEREIIERKATEAQKPLADALTWCLEKFGRYAVIENALAKVKEGK